MTPDDDEDEGDDLGPEPFAPLQSPTDVMHQDNAESREGRRSRRRYVREAREFWAKALVDKVGRREIWSLLDSMHPFETRFATGPNGFPQPEGTWFHAGQQSIGLTIYFSLLKLNREGVLLMQMENDPQFREQK
jgi:hypothetical protein